MSADFFASAIPRLHLLTDDFPANFDAWDRALMAYLTFTGARRIVLGLEKEPGCWNAFDPESMHPARSFAGEEVPCAPGAKSDKSEGAGDALHADHREKCYPDWIKRYPSWPDWAVRERAARAVILASVDGHIYDKVKNHWSASKIYARIQYFAAIQKRDEEEEGR